MSVPVISLLFAVAAHAAEAPVDGWMDAVVLVQLGSTTCAGALVDADGTVVTAYHCVAPGGRPRVTARDGARGVGRVTAADRRRDLAVISVPDLAGHGWLRVKGTPPPLGAEVWALGHPSGGDLPAGFYSGTLRFSATSGIVSAVGTDALQVSAPINPGNSGGPVVDAGGNLVAVVSRRLAGQSLGFAGRASHVLPLLEADGGQGALGGTVALEGAFTAMDRGSTAVAARLEVALRDRVFLLGSVAFPLSPRWSTARFGESVVLRGEARAGLRQRLGHGPWATRIDAWGGVAQRERLSASEADPLSWQTDVALVPTVGGTLRTRAIGFELAVGLTEPIGRASVVLRLPGVFTVF